jgi:hypothetical protein
MDEMERRKTNGKRQEVLPVYWILVGQREEALR